MDAMAAKAIQPYLQPGETLKWAGRPGSGVRFHKWEKLAIPFFIVWGGGAIAMEASALLLGVSDLGFHFVGILFSIMGIYILVGRFIYDAKRRAGTCYGLTNERALIAGGIFRKSLKSIYISNMFNVLCSEESDGTGSIHFGNEWGSDRMYRTLYGTPTAFEFIPDCRQVYTLIEQVRRASRATS